MAHNPMPEPDPLKPVSTAAGGLVTVKGEISGPEELHFETDLGELAATFATQGGGKLSAELSADLALEVVLNEVVEQACLATGAMGAAIILERDGAMVCRASSGANAPDLGTRFEWAAGLTALCLKTAQVVRCDDALTDARADVEASRQLGVRSVMIFPLPREGRLVGVIEIWSPRPGVFGDRDEITLEALARRVVKNLEQASGTLRAASPLVPVRSSSIPESKDSVRETDASLKANAAVANSASRSPRRALDITAFALGVAVLVCAVLLGAMVSVKLGWRKATGSRAQVAAVGAQNGTKQGIATPTGREVSPKDAVGVNLPSTPASPAIQNLGGTFNAKKDANTPKSTTHVRSSASPVPEGSLLVYENGKEVFRMPPSPGGGRTEITGGTNVRPASSIESAPIVELSPDAAEGGLLRRVEPEYPEEARQQQIQGPVQLDVRIGRDGAVQDVKVVSGQPLLAEAAVAAVKQWRFKPRTVEGQPTAMQTTVTLNFRLSH